MEVTICAVGRAKDGPERALFRQHAARLGWTVTLKEVDEKRRLPPDRLKAREAAALLAAVPKGAYIVALDERGRCWDSVTFARQLDGWFTAGGGRVAFLIGGANGHGEAVRAQAGTFLSLGPMTWPHMLVRGLLAEQLFRAQAILSGHPYHRA